MSNSRSPVVIAGMHRSGTSLATSILAASGLDVGKRLLAADANNRKGYFEDEAFLELNRRILAECCEEGDGGHVDWGWTESETLDPNRFSEYRDEARRLLAGLDRSRRWGFKDPRTTLLLDFWHRELEDARYLLVYRSPWDVADSMQRLGADVFLRHPEYAPRIWTFYNRHLLDFFRRHSERAVLASTGGLLAEPERFAGLVREKLDLELDLEAMGKLFEEELLTSLPADDPLIGLTAATSPACVELLEELDGAADLPSGAAWRKPRKLSPPALSRARGPRVSVVLPCRDHGQFLLEAIASAERSLGDMPYEMIIVDDGSAQPRTVEILRTLSRAGYRILDGRGRGVSAARNLGFGAASAPFVVPLDADNRLRPGFVEQALEKLEGAPRLGAVYGDRYEFGRREGRREPGPLDLDKLLDANYIDACAVISKAMWKDVGGYDEDIPAWEDWELWLQAARRGWRLKYLGVVAFDYRVRPDSLTATNNQGEVIQATLDHTVAKHHQLFHDHLVRRLGHALGTWALRPQQQDLASRLLESKEKISSLTTQAARWEEQAAQLEREVGRLEDSEGETRLQLERARVEKLEAQHEAERMIWKGDHARAAARSFEDLAAQLQAQMSLQSQLHDRHHHELIGEIERRRAGEEALRQALDHERGRAAALEATLTQLSRSRVYRLLNAWWSFVGRLRGGRSQSQGVGVPTAPPVEDGAGG